MTKSIKQAGIISDANVLIDYAKSAPNILQQINKYVKKLYIPLPILSEVKQLNESDIKKLGIEIIEPTLNQIIEANKIRLKRLSGSAQDAICFVIARDNNWACLTNDKALRNYCTNYKITCMWGIGIMHHLVAAGKLTPEKAFKIAQDIQSKNKRVTPAIIKRFQKQLGL